MKEKKILQMKIIEPFKFKYRYIGIGYSTPEMDLLNN